MTSKVVNVLRAGFTLAAFGLGLQTLIPAVGAELDGFAINTQDKAVTVTLFTDQRANYTTEHHGKQFTIVLPQTQLSKEQLDNGLPVVIDNKNRFIGRAVPTDDGKVKIILPNLPAEEYSVSIQQKRTGQSTPAPASKPAESLKPRPAVQAEAESHFEQVASSFPKPAAKPTHSTNQLKLSPAPQKANRGQVWNPYVYRPSDFQQPVNKAATPAPARKVAPMATNPTNEPVSTVSVAESAQQFLGNSTSGSQQGTNAAHNDPLWYLHALPPTNSEVSQDNLQGPAAQLLPFGPAPLNTVAQTAAQPAPSEIKELTAEIRKGFQSLPRWLVITVAVFLGGMGLFSLIGGLVLLRLLFSQNKLNLSGNTAQNGLPYGVMPLYTSPDAAALASNANQASKTGYASRPSYGPTSLHFEDKASIQALDYLKNNASNVTQAVYNSSLVKFPSSSKQRSISRKKVSHS